MSQANLTSRNEDTYESLISLIENSQGQLAPILVACDDMTLRNQIIDRYEQEARQAKIQPYRITLGSEPSVRAGLAKWKESEVYLQQNGEAVFTVTGAELLLWVKLRPEDEQSDLDKFFGYLQWTREGLRQFPYPIVLWVTHRILKEMPRRAPDFWSWRKTVLRFADETSDVKPVTSHPISLEKPIRPVEPQPEDEFLPPLEELQTEIQQLESTSPESLSLATLYDRLGQVYAKRVNQGEANYLDQERQLAIAAFKKAIARYQSSDNSSALWSSLNRLGNFLDSQSRFTEAIDYDQQALELVREIGDHAGEAKSLRGLGNSYNSLGQYQRAIDFYQQSLKIARKISDHEGEADSLIGLGNAYASLGKYQRAIDFYQQALKIEREIGALGGEAVVLGNLGNAYHSLGEYQRAIDLYQQTLEIKRKIGDFNGESGALCNLGNVYESLGEDENAIAFYRQALKIQREVGNRDWEANSLGGLGNVYRSLEQYQQAIDFYQQTLDIKREIGDLSGEAKSLFNMGHALAKLDHHFNAKRSYEQALEIYTQLKLDHQIEKCKTEIYAINQIIAAQPTRAPTIHDELPLARPSRRRRRFLSRLRQFFRRLWQRLIGQRGERK
jgi:tetratricopeptide (TPR) repeat protein